MSKMPDDARRQLTKISFSVMAAAILVSAAVVVASLIQAHNAGRFIAQDPDDFIAYPDNVPATPAGVTSSPGCNQSLWQHVHQPSRLRILDNCLQVSGTIAAVKAEGDGDYDIWLRPNLQDLRLLNLKNVLATGGNLVTEAVCTRAPIDDDAVAACNGLIHHINIPPVGTHVVITGSYVVDMPHGWTEIHPITSIMIR